MKEKVIQIVSQVMGVPADQINEESSPENIGAWDSLNHMNLILALEEEFEVHFPDEKIMETLSVGAIIASITELSPSANDVIQR